LAGILAFDLGASGGRAVLGRLSNSRLETKEIHRFPNDPVQVGDRLHWDILRLYHEMKNALVKAGRDGSPPASLGIDSWAVDFGLIGANGELLGNPYHYRDRRNVPAMETLLKTTRKEDVFARTGIQFLPFNTIYQLYAMQQDHSPLLKMAGHFLMIPDLLRYFLTGEKYHEFTNATTTQLYNPLEGGWDGELIRQIGVPASLFGKVLKAGSEAGSIRPSVREELGIGGVRVYAVAEHDTGSAVAAIPAVQGPFAYLSCGTWSLLGTEVVQPVMTETALKLNFTNEGGAFGTYRLLKNIMGLWILEECRREWERAGMVYSYSELVRLAAEARPFQLFFDPDDPLFLPPGKMVQRIRQYAEKTGQRAPESPGETARVVLENLAFKYRYVLEQTEQLSGRTFGCLHMVGGGTRNKLLCQWTANAIGKPVVAGPEEGSAIGNLVVQWIARGEFKDLWEARKAIRESFPPAEYEPEHSDDWQEAYERFLQKTGL